MELVKETIKTSRFSGKTVSQITLEDDFNVPDIKPDVVQIIEETGEIKITEARSDQGKIQLRGKLDFSILYVGSGGSQVLQKMTGSIGFDEQINMDGLEQDDTLSIGWDMEDLRTRMINSRKISVRSIVMLSITASKIVEEEAAMMKDNGDGIQTLGTTIDFSQIHSQKKDIVRIRKEIQVPSSKPGIMDIIWDKVTAGKIETKVLDGRVNVRGDMNVFVMYTSAEEDNPLQYFTAPIDFNESVETPGTREEMIGHIEIRFVQAMISSKENEDGEMRLVEAEIVLELHMSIYEERHVNFLADIYANDRQLTPVSKAITFDNILMQNQSMIKLGQSIQTESSSGKILQICQTDANVKVDRMVNQGEGILVEGVVYVRILYIAADDTMPVSAIKGMLPFSHVIEVAHLNDQCTFEVIPVLNNIASTMADSDSVEVRAELLFNTIVFQRSVMNIILNVEESPMDFQTQENMPGIIGYIVSPGDTLWSLAKRFYTTKEQLMALNQLESEVLTPKQKLLIVKEPLFSIN